MSWYTTMKASAPSLTYCTSAPENTIEILFGLGRSAATKIAAYVDDGLTQLLALHVRVAYQDVAIDGSNIVQNGPTYDTTINIPLSSMSQVLNSCPTPSDANDATCADDNEQLSLYYCLHLTDHIRNDFMTPSKAGKFARRIVSKGLVGAALLDSTGSSTYTLNGIAYTARHEIMNYVPSGTTGCFLGTESGCTMSGADVDTPQIFAAMPSAGTGLRCNGVTDAISSKYPGCSQMYFAAAPMRTYLVLEHQTTGASAATAYIQHVDTSGSKISPVSDSWPYPNLGTQATTTDSVFPWYAIMLIVIAGAFTMTAIVVGLWYNHKKRTELLKAKLEGK